MISKGLHKYGHHGSLMHSHFLADRGSVDVNVYIHLNETE